MKTILLSATLALLCVLVTSTMNSCSSTTEQNEQTQKITTGPNYGKPLKFYASGAIVWDDCGRTPEEYAEGTVDTLDVYTPDGKFSSTWGEGYYMPIKRTSNRDTLKIQSDFEGLRNLKFDEYILCDCSVSAGRINNGQNLYGGCVKLPKKACDDYRAGR